MIREIALRIQCSHAARTSRGNRLTVARILDIPTREEAGDIRLGAAWNRFHIAFFVELEKTVDQRHVWLVTDRGEDAIEKKGAMDTYWVPGVNNLGSHGRWAFAEFTDVWQIQSDFAQKVEAEFSKMVSKTLNQATAIP